MVVVEKSGMEELPAKEVSRHEREGRIFGRWPRCDGRGRVTRTGGTGDKASADEASDEASAGSSGGEGSAEARGDSRRS